MEEFIGRAGTQDPLAVTIRSGNSPQLSQSYR
ncbi:hypothetical protein [Mesorhizobium sp.]|nr:hypothetical protein [Mesorhizobium sp.]